MSDIILKEESFLIIGICMNIHNSLGMGLKEINYKDAMQMDFEYNNIPFSREKKYEVRYKNQVLRNPYIADFVVFDSMILEIKSTPLIHPAHLAQTKSYLAVSKLKLGLVINFGEKSLTWKRILL